VFRSRPVNLCLRPRGARFGPDQGCFAPAEALPGGCQPAEGALDGLLRTPVPVCDEHGKVTDQINEALFALISPMLTLIGHPLAHIRPMLTLASLLLTLVSYRVALVSLAFAPAKSGGACFR
jgi:hypothetical protein